MAPFCCRLSFGLWESSNQDSCWQLNNAFGTCLLTTKLGIDLLPSFMDKWQSVRERLGLGLLKLELL